MHCWCWNLVSKFGFVKLCIRVGLCPSGFLRNFVCFVSRAVKFFSKAPWGHPSNFWMGSCVSWLCVLLVKIFPPIVLSVARQTGSAVSREETVAQGCWGDRRRCQAVKHVGDEKNILSANCVLIIIDFNQLVYLNTLLKQDRTLLCRHS